MWPDRRLCDLLQIDHPIIQAPMVGSCTPALAAAVSNAGGLGSLGCGERTFESIRIGVIALKRATNRPFNLNFFVRPEAKTDPEIFRRTRERLLPWYERLGLGDPPAELPEIGPGFDRDRLQLILELKPAVVSFHFGVPDAEAISVLKSAGIRLLSTATTVAEAKALQAAGMDAIIAQGWEAGGHRGSHVPRLPADGVGTIALTPQIVDAVSVPVIAAGGIGDGRGIGAAFALGAAGVQIGTAFLSCPEAATDAARRALLRAAIETDTIVTDAFSGRAARTRRSRYAVEMEQKREPIPDFIHMYTLSQPICDGADDSDANFHLYGQAAALNRELPAAELLARLVEETFDVFSRLGTPKP
jgi:nitronate monooxygenase